LGAGTDDLVDIIYNMEERSMNIQGFQNMAVDTAIAPTVQTKSLVDLEDMEVSLLWHRDQWRRFKLQLNSTELPFDFPRFIWIEEGWVSGPGRSNNNLTKPSNCFTATFSLMNGDNKALESCDDCKENDFKNMLEINAKCRILPLKDTTEKQSFTIRLRLKCWPKHRKDLDITTLRLIGTIKDPNGCEVGHCTYTLPDECLKASRSKERETKHEERKNNKKPKQSFEVPLTYWLIFSLLEIYYSALVKQFPSCCCRLGLASHFWCNGFEEAIRDYYDVKTRCVGRSILLFVEKEFQEEAQLLTNIIQLFL